MLKIIIILVHLIAIECASVETNWVLDENCTVDGVAFEPGVYKRPFADKCMYMYCTADGVATIANCPKYARAPTDCEYGNLINPNGDYPKCCRKEIICKDDD